MSWIWENITLPNGIIIDFFFFHLLSPLKLPVKVEDGMWQSGEVTGQFSNTPNPLIWASCSVRKQRSNQSQQYTTLSLLRPGTKIKLSSSFTVQVDFPFIESIHPLHGIFTSRFTVNLYLASSLSEVGLTFRQYASLGVIIPLLPFLWLQQLPSPSGCLWQKLIECYSLLPSVLLIFRGTSFLHISINNSNILKC